MGYKDLAGLRFGDLVVVGLSHRDSKRCLVWDVLCKFGTTHKIRGGTLASGNTNVCKCAPRPALRPRERKKHGSSPERRAWQSARYRVLSEKSPKFSSYGGRGITMAEEWVNNFKAFLEHVGPRPSSEHSLDRVNNDKGYEPGNVRWATRAEQASNKRWTRFLTVDGITLSLADWCRLKCVSPGLGRARLDLGWDHEAALNTPSAKKVPG